MYTLMSDLLETVGDEDPGLVDAQVSEGVTEGRHIPGGEGTRLVHRTAVLPGVKQHGHLGARNHRQVHLVEVYNENSDSQWLVVYIYLRHIMNKVQT